MIKETKRTVIEGILEDVGTGSRYAWAVEGISLERLIQSYVSSNVRITIETIEE